MEFTILDNTLKEKYKSQIYQMLAFSDKEFVPPLSCRNSTTQKNLVGVANQNGIKDYFEGLLSQHVLGIFIDGKLAGILSFITDYTNPELKNIALPNIYLSTLVISPNFRGKGITKKAYDYLFNDMYKGYTVYTRTWSTNHAHLKILAYFGFKLVLNKPNDRGEGIDTVYFELRR